MIYVPRETSESIYKEKRSIFTGIIQPVTAKGKADDFLKHCRKQNPKARHICWAYRIYEHGIIYENSSDAGEPSGTAGKPILNNLLKKKFRELYLNRNSHFRRKKIRKKRAFSCLQYHSIHGIG